MVVCLCNAMTDGDVRAAAVAAGAARPKEIYGLLRQAGPMRLLHPHRAADPARGGGQGRLILGGAGQYIRRHHQEQGTMPKGDPKVIEHLNIQLTNELTAIN